MTEQVRMSGSLRVVATLFCHPGAGDRAVAAARACITETRKEPGCIEYDAYRADDAPDRITFVELWDSQAALDTHNRSPHLLALVGAIGPLAASPLEVLVLTPV